jgi:hypothetical protein
MVLTMVNNSIDCNHEWKCSDVPGVFDCSLCEDIRIFNYKKQEYKSYASWGGE